MIDETCATIKEQTEQCEPAIDAWPIQKKSIRTLGGGIYEVRPLSEIHLKCVPAGAAAGLLQLGLLGVRSQKWHGRPGTVQISSPNSDKLGKRIE